MRLCYAQVMFIKGSAPQIPLPTLLVALDSPTTAKALDQVDLGSFQPDKVFTRNNAACLAALATVSYSTPEDQAAHLKQQSAVKSFHVLSSANNAKLGIASPDKGANVTVVETDGALFVAARGTAPPWLGNHGQENEWSWKDLAADLNTIPVKNYDGSALVHQGFKDQADSIWAQLKPLLQSALASHKAIHMTGHSLGAAVAMQLADRLHHETGVLPQSLLRMGGPDVGWKDEKRHLDQIGLSDRTVNIHNSGDPIPLALPGGETAGHELYFDRRGRADIGGGRHLIDRARVQLDDFLSGHGAIPLYRHFPQFYNYGLAEERNARVLAQLEERMNPPV